MPNTGKQLPPKPEEAWQDGIQPADVARLLAEINTSLASMENRMAGMENCLRKHIATAFPGGDADGHRRAHDTMIAQVDERRKLRMAIQEKTLSGLAWSAIVALGIAAWTWLQVKLGVKVTP